MADVDHGRDTATISKLGYSFAIKHEARPYEHDLLSTIMVSVNWLAYVHPTLLPSNAASHTGREHG